MFSCLLLLVFYIISGWSLAQSVLLGQALNFVLTGLLKNSTITVYHFRDGDYSHVMQVAWKTLDCICRIMLLIAIQESVRFMLIGFVFWR